MNQEQIACCICKKAFTESSQPRMMPYCQHSACTACLKQFISKKKTNVIVCQHCGHEEKISEVDLEYFPKNICLTKMLKEKSISLNNSSSNQQESSRDTISSGSITQVEVQLCHQHKKEMEIICLNDRTRLCPHCALFGGHKDHKFKTLPEVNELMQLTRQQFQSFKMRKVELDSRINSNEFKEGIIKKIGQEKDRLIYEIKKKFAQITENVKLAEKKAYEDVVKNFKTVYSKISTLLKEENDSQKKYKQWELKCTELFQKSEKMKRIEDKVALYYDGPLEICNEGESIIKRLESKVNSNISTIEVMISQIKVVENAGISNSVFNYINVFLQDTELDGLGFVHQQVISPREYKEVRKQHKIQFGADHLTPEREALSPVPRKKSKSKDIAASKMSNSEKRSSAKAFVSPQRGSVNSLIEEFCQRENLDTLDLTGYSLSDIQIYEVMSYLKPIKKIKGLKLVKNKLTNDGLARIIQFMPYVTNINLSFNQLGDDSIVTLLNNRSKIPSLRIINLSNNKINERKTKNAIDQLKKQGVIVTI